MADKQNWDLINAKNSIGPALGMAMGKAIDIVLGSPNKKSFSETKDDILHWRDWIYDQNAKKHQELLADLPKEGEDKEFADNDQKDLF